MAQQNASEACTPWPKDQDVLGTTDLLCVEFTSLAALLLVLQLDEIETDYPIIYKLDTAQLGDLPLPPAMDLDDLGHPGVAGLAGAFYGFKVRSHLQRLTHEALKPEDRQRTDTVGAKIIELLGEQNDKIVEYWNTHVPQLQDDQAAQLEARVIKIASAFKAHCQV